jgi:hypothetical protein
MPSLQAATVGPAEIDVLAAALGAAITELVPEAPAQ